ncbi:rna-directed dna polymerase from mobile element jockey-like [Limosa lapponica baueri]|uniref:Rna-directed dna polymerase from mobile element jockey-like n=1 Tax=Limosa lapponica baueri TaxID=1758121 RepID=A0A2I0UJK0_LIMLA|nr:rna-directed dna polymerase from mobile element jockey-like [Limosa lapponica baueri]
MSVLGLVLFNIFIVDMDSGIECTHNKFGNNIKLCGAVNTVKGRHAIQGNTDRLERWVCANLMKFNKATCKVMHLGHGNPRYKHRLGREWIESSPEEDLGVLVPRREAQHETATWAGSPESQPYPGLHQKKRGQQVKGGDSTPLPYSHETRPGVLHPAMEPPTKEGQGPVGVSPEEGHKDD